MDIEKCFDKINHQILDRFLERYMDQPTRELVQKLIKVGYIDIHNLNDRTRYSVEGIPQGSLLSPILCNIYLHALDEFIIEKLSPT